MNKNKSFLLFTLLASSITTHTHSLPYQQEETKFWSLPSYLFASEQEAQEFFMQEGLGQKMSSVGLAGLAIMWLNRTKTIQLPFSRPLSNCIEAILGIAAISGFITWLWQQYNLPDSELPQPYDFSD